MNTSLSEKAAHKTPIEIHTITDGLCEARISTYGGVVVSLKVPDRNGRLADIVLGFDDPQDYVSHFNGPNNAFFGAIIGRYANRIASGSFDLGGKKYTLIRNEGDNTLHGGPGGFHNVLWSAKAILSGVELSCESKDGDGGFPGNLRAEVRYTLRKGELQVEYSAATDRDTVINLTNHWYFNLAGRGDILGHRLTLHASRFTPVDGALIPTGEFKSVDHTAFDFRKATVVGTVVESEDPQLRAAGGYDHNWILDHGGAKLGEAAEVYDPMSGRVLSVLTDQPGLQFYSGNFLDGSVKGKGGTPIKARSGLCLETQHFPDSPNHSNFPSTELKAGDRYHSITVYRFSTR